MIPMQLTHVMVVDDERDIVSVMTQMLEGKGYKVHGFTEPVRALAHAKNCNKCGIVISDVRMPEMNGFEFVRALKEIRREMKVILLSAFEINQREWESVMPDVEVDQFLVKPLRAKQLVETIEKCVPMVLR